MITNYPGMIIKPGSMGKPFQGITAAVLDPKTYEPILAPENVGLIAFKPGWPAMMRAYWQNDEKYLQKFVNGWYLSGDKASIDKEGFF